MIHFSSSWRGLEACTFREDYLGEPLSSNECTSLRFTSLPFVCGHGHGHGLCLPCRSCRHPHILCRKLTKPSSKGRALISSCATAVGWKRNIEVRGGCFVSSFGAKVADTFRKSRELTQGGCEETLVVFKSLSSSWIFWCLVGWKFGKF